MSITVKQLETLSQYFHFDLDEAREVIGLKPKVKTKSACISNNTTIRGHYNSNSKEERGFYKPKAKPSASATAKDRDKANAQDKEKKTRSPSGYNIFVREEGVSFKNAGAQWKSLTQNERDKWNARAKQ